MTTDTNARPRLHIRFTDGEVLTAMNAIEAALLIDVALLERRQLEETWATYEPDEADVAELRW